MKSPINQSGGNTSINISLVVKHQLKLIDLGREGVVHESSLDTV